MRQGSFRPGDVVEIRAPEEILGTLDERGVHRGMPFMPEMLAFVGRRFTVAKRVEKICDTVTPGGGPKSRRMRDAVFLEDLRCDGSGHDGCQAACRLYWSEAWLKPVEGDSASRDPADEDGLSRLERLTRANARVDAGEATEGTIRYRCQATQALEATTPLHPLDPRQYAREVASGNVRVRALVRVGARAFAYWLGRTLRIIGAYPFRWHRPGVLSKGELDLRRGELVRVKPRDEIARTLDQPHSSRGLSFDTEMLPYCGRTFRVRDVVKRIIDETTGEMIEFKSDCITLDGAVCSGERSWRRWFCARDIYPFWREAWLERVNESAGPASETPSAASASN